MQLLHHARELERHQSEHDHPEGCGDDLLLLLLRLELIDLLCHQGAPAADALVPGVGVVVVVDVVVVDVVSVPVVVVAVVDAGVSVVGAAPGTP